MLSPDELYDVLYSMPKNISDDISVLEDLDFEEVPKERIEKLIYIINHSSDYVFFDVIKSATLLSNWGVYEGFHFLDSLLKNENFINEDLIDKEVYKMILYSIVGYWSSVATNEKDNVEIRKIILKPLSSLITIAKYRSFDISHVYFMITEYGFTELIPLVKDYLFHIIDDEQQYWNTHDAIELMTKLDLEFVMQLLKQKGKKLSYFNIS